MKNFRKLQMTLFDSTNASFKIGVEAQFVRGNQQTGYHDLVYIGKSGTGVLNPNIYLTFTCKETADPNAAPNPVYTSYPQLFRLRAAFEQVKDLVATEKGFVKAPDGTIAVQSEYANPIVVDNIGKGNNWVSLKLCVLQTGDNGVVTSIPGVSLELSTGNGYKSCLSVEEFLTVYTIIKDIDLAQLACTMSLAYLETDGVNGAYAAVGPVYQQPAPVYPAQPVYQQPAPVAAQQYYGGPRPQPAAPRYGNQGYRTPSPRAPYQPQPAPAPVADPDSTPMMAPRPQPAPQAPANTLPPRGNKPVVNLKAVDETPVSTISFDDAAALDAMFDEE